LSLGDSLLLTEKIGVKTTAKSIFREYLKLASENPDLADGNYALLITPGKKDKYE
jgi:hypothetical protein